MDGQCLPGTLTPLQVCFYSKPQMIVPGAALFLNRINKRVTEERLKEICGKFGPVVSVRVKTLQAPSGEQLSKGKAIVAYGKREHAEKAMQQLYFEDELGLNMEVDFYEGRDQREYRALKHSVENPINNFLYSQFTRGRKPPVTFAGHGGQGPRGQGYDGSRSQQSHMQGSHNHHVNQHSGSGYQQRFPGSQQSQIGGNQGNHYN